MISPKEKYENDAAYKQAVDVMETLIYEGKFTPSEMREMAVMASIHYEMSYGFTHYPGVTMKIKEAFEILKEYRENNVKELKKRKSKENKE